MAKVQIWGFRCERCGHEWAPREPQEAPTVCPKCKSPYWNRPRRNEVSPEHQVRCAWTVPNLDGKLVEYEIARNKKLRKGGGYFSVSDLGDSLMQISICPFEDPSNPIKLVQAEADCIKTHPGKYRFSCFSLA
jgi:hypothetical protein